MKNNRLLEGKNAIVTGCARGIGKEIVKVLAQNGCNIWACARTKSDEFESYILELGENNSVNIWPIYFDMQDKEQMKNAIKAIGNEKRNIDILVNNAGITYNALFQMSTVSMINQVMDINFVSPFLFTQYILKYMLKNLNGTIINISSTAAIDANSGRSVYGASKAALLCATKALASELGEKGIRANIIAPGVTKTDMISSMSDEVINETILGTDIKRMGETNDIANAVLFLASDLSSYMTGQVIRVDGGM